MVCLNSVLLGLALTSSTFAIGVSSDHKNSTGQNPWLIQDHNNCRVIAKGAGQDDGPTIVEAFSRCGENGKIQLDGYYVRPIMNFVYGSSEQTVVCRSWARL